MKILKDVEKLIRLPPSCNRQDVRLLNNRILPSLLRSRRRRIVRLKPLLNVKNVSDEPGKPKEKQNFWTKGYN